ncbi:peptide ABC transporter substrate-binding protein [Sporomusa acidovorans]|uniref:Dipeptide-binding protein DppE n=1 Tax=Sporomusa acidovorans (strain ATCC 49682 / DSM 3132 / Mol) TaxID=1123286 RepID=A0ABZ3J9I4_SPOA4|nr:peptide ABC transporter substrate-binding protein [Sporomusa acidovorans]OZC16100.1 dipeptide-binding protein DppE precursor [Sporomusa acidovorans DSM 3132]SDD86720.1 oligopeptide transport system substrate-binding protein [Sporomusa acidovorans]
MSCKKLCAVLLTMAMLLTLAAGCGKSGTSSNEQVLRYALEAEPATLDPAKSTAIPESLVELQIFEGLTRLDAKDQPVAGAAEKWDVSADGLTYIFHLRANAKWSNGDPVTAHDFAFAWKRALNPETASENAYMLFPLKNAQAYNEKKVSVDQVGVKVIDDHTLEVSLEKPTAYFLNLVAFHAFYPVHQKTVTANADKWAGEAGTLIGNGPFKISNWTHSGKIEFVKNDQYWDAGAVKLAKMEWPISDSQTTRLAMLENNQVDMMVEPPVVEHDRLTQAGLLKVSPFLGIYYYVFNTQKPPFDNVKVRKAFAAAINRDMLVKNVIKGGKKPAYAWVAPGLTNPVSGKDFREEGGNYALEDVAQAKKLLAEAGYPDGQGLPPVTLLFNTSELHKSIAEAMQEMWKQNLGVTVDLTNQESKVFLATRTEGDFQIARASWTGDYADPMTFMDVFKDPENDAKYASPAYNRLIEQAQSTTDQKVRMQAMHDAEKILFDDAVIIPIYYTTQPYMTKPYVKGYFWSVLGLADFKAAYIEK